LFFFQVGFWIVLWCGFAQFPSYSHTLSVCQSIVSIGLSEPTLWNWVNVNYTLFLILFTRLLHAPVFMGPTSSFKYCKNFVFFLFARETLKLLTWYVDTGLGLTIINVLLNKLIHTILKLFVFYVKKM
jgi:hypothetical protein